MSPNRRIFVNVLASYGRSLYALVCGLFTARWVLMSLGETDFGLYGVIGGLIAFVGFLNGLLAGVVGRFYAYEVGAAEQQCGIGVENSIRWFNVATCVHTVLPTILIAVGYPLGVWAINNYLVVPPDRIEHCLWVWRFSLVTCFVSMVTVPVNAMFTAKQDIAELTAYSLITTTLNVVALFYMVNHPAVWLARYAACMMVTACLPLIIIYIRGFYKYEECRYRFSYMFDIVRLKALFAYAGGRFVCALSQLLSTSGLSVLVNRMLGPLGNAAMNVGNSVSQHCNTLASSFMTAFMPAITNAAGAKNYALMRKFMYASCLSGAAATMVFSLPLLAEIDTILAIWLKNPPLHCAEICVCLLSACTISSMATGLWIGIFAIGRIGRFQICEALCWFLVLPLAYVGLKARWNMLGVGISLVAANCLVVLVDVLFAHRHCGIQPFKWIRRVAMPVIFISLVSLPIGLIVRLWMPPTFLRVVCSTAAVEVVFLPLCWFLLLPDEVKSRLLTTFSNWRQK